MRANDQRCGTPTGYSRHQDRKEKPCDACAEAKREYDKRWRSATETQQRNRISAASQQAAYRRLAHLHPGLYQAFYAEEKEQRLRDAGLEVRTFGRNGQKRLPLKKDGAA